VTATVLLPHGVGAYVGALVGPVVSDKIHEVLADMAQRQLSEKEGQRVRAAVSVSEDIVRTNLAEGKNPRSDWFGNTWGDPLPDDATEIIEGVLMAAQHEHETRKVAILGRILGNLAFTPQIDRDYANILIRSASELTYRQFCILALLARGDSEELDLPVKLEVGDGSGPIVGLLTEMYDLYRRTMVQQRSHGEVQGFMALKAFDLQPKWLRTVRGPGGWLATLGDVDASIPSAEIERVAQTLRDARQTTADI